MEQVIKDNQTVSFPVEHIRKELIHMLIAQDEFQYFTEQAYRKLKRKFGQIIAATFLEILEREMKLKNEDLFSLELEEYVLRVETLIETLEEIKITTISRDAPDYEMVLEMSKK